LVHSYSLPRRGDTTTPTLGALRKAQCCGRNLVLARVVYRLKPDPVQRKALTVQSALVKLVIQIPAYNEEANLPQVLAEIPREIPGFTEVLVVVLDDGSTDRTVEIAREHGADLVVCNPANLGLARTFARGIDTALSLGADVIVNTDGDNQYPGKDIPALVAPLLANRADIAIGNRRPGSLKHFSVLKRFLQRLGNGVISRLTGVSIPDGVSGFRAYSRDAALRLVVQTGFSYTLETLLQAVVSGCRVEFVDIDVNPTSRPSRLAANVYEFVVKQGTTILRTLTINRPVWAFSVLGSVLTLPGLVLGFRFIYHLVHGRGDGYVQSLILTAILLVCGFFSFTLAAAMDVIASNRKLLEEQRYITRKQYYESRRDESQR